MTIPCALLTRISQAAPVPTPDPAGRALDNALGAGLDRACLAIWTVMCDFLADVLTLIDTLGTFSVDPHHSVLTPLWGPMVTVSIALTLVLFFVQLTLGMLVPHKHLGQAVVGPIQYVVCLAVATALVTAVVDVSTGITDLLLTSAGHLPAGAGIADAARALDLKNVPVDTTKPLVLGVLGVFALPLLALGFIVELVFRQAGILILIATLPITAAGLTAAATKHWFWRTVRWLLAAVFMQPTFAAVLLIGLGILRGAGGAPGAPAGSGNSGLMSLVVGIGVLFICLLSPWPLFRLMAWVEPGTTANDALKGAVAGARQNISGMRGLTLGDVLGDPAAVLSAATAGRWDGGASAGERHHVPAARTGGHDGNGHDGNGPAGSGGHEAGPGDPEAAPPPGAEPVPSGSTSGAWRDVEEGPAGKPVPERVRVPGDAPWPPARRRRGPRGPRTAHRGPRRSRH